MVQTNAVLLNQLKSDYEALKSIGSPILGSQGMLVPRNFPEIRILIKSCTRPIVANADPAVTQMAGGLENITAGIVKTAYTGPISIIETEAGHAQMFAELIVASGGQIDCDYYDGRVDSFTRVYEMLNCAIRFEPTDFDSDNKSATMVVTGQMDYNYFGNFASIGNNGTVLPGQRTIAGVSDLVSRVQSVISVAQQATSAVGAISRLGGLFG